MKLTKAQQRVLDEVERNGVFRFAEGYKPAERLAEMGLVKMTKMRFGACILEPLTDQ